MVPKKTLYLMARKKKNKKKRQNKLIENPVMNLKITRQLSKPRRKWSGFSAKGTKAELPKTAILKLLKNCCMTALQKKEQVRLTTYLEENWRITTGRSLGQK